MVSPNPPRTRCHERASPAMSGQLALGHEWLLLAGRKRRGRACPRSFEFHVVASGDAEGPGFQPGLPGRMPQEEASQIPLYPPEAEKESSI